MGKKILIVDDDRPMVDVLAIRLKAYGYDVFEAFDGAEGLGLWRSVKPDLILLDIRMPRVDGFSFLQEAKTDTTLSPAPIVILTINEGMGDLFKVEGAVDYVTKPFQEDVLLEKIRKHIG